MEEVVQSPPKFNKEDEDDDEIYETIEAPKFVDFTRDLPLPDDRSWFCIRIGCDQKHEEIDPDALYKSFVLRVMAARSPNLRLRKALSRQAPRANLKCPLSAPAKPSKSRISRLNAIASISQKMVDAKVKVVHPLSKLNSTPNCKAKEPPIASKALTTPRHKKGIPNLDPFRSVRNPKTTVALTKNRVVAKALVFNSPKKTERQKTSFESRTPMKEICSGMKKLEISSQRKVSKNSSKPLRRTLRGPNKSVTALDPLKSQLSTQKSKIWVEVSGNSKDPKAKSSLRCLRRKSGTNLTKFRGPTVPQEGVDNVSSDMEIDGKSRNGSPDVHSIIQGSARSNERNGEEHIITVIANSETDVSNSEIYLEEKDPPKFQTTDGEGDESNEGNGHEEILREKEVSVLQTSNGDGVGTKKRDNDDKENVAAPNDDRASQRNIDKHEAQEKRRKAICVMGKTFKGSSTMDDTTGSQGGKYKKTKPTNPKPFRLRTDERGILREANLEKRHFLAPLKEITQVPKFPDRNSQRRHGNERNKKSNGHVGNQIELDKRIQKVQPQPRKPTYLRTPKCAVEPTKMATTSTQNQKKMEDGKEKALDKKLENRTTAKSQLLRRQFVRPQRVGGTRKAAISTVSPVQLSVIKENSSTISRIKDAAPQTEKNGTITTDAVGAAASAGRSSSRGRRPTTVPKEPIFHRIHTPKGCTKFSS